MTSDKENYYLTARLEAYESEVLMFGKDVSKTIKRNFKYPVWRLQPKSLADQDPSRSACGKV
jgi:hypothetical protein